MIGKISKTDWWVMIGFWIMASPIVISDYISHMSFLSAAKLLIVDVILITAACIVTVFFLAPKYLSNRRYVLFFIGLFVLLFLQAMLYFVGYGVIWSWKVPDSWLEFIGDEIVSGGQSLGVLGGILLAKKYFEGQQNVMKLEAETKANELRALQSQVNPHFLFNNLNSLDELIGANPEEAKKYVNKLAQLYRYLINSKDDDVVTLHQEMEFAENYIYLLNQRYGASYRFEIIHHTFDYDSVLLPPASLQLILENVVKHNIGNLEEPLTTSIRIKDESITISNTKRMKKNTSDMGTGLKNLITRYRLLSDLEIKIEDTADIFSISLPLISLIK